MSVAGLPPGDPLRVLAPGELDTLLNDVVEQWPTSRMPMPDHIRMEIAAAHHRGRPLEPGQPVPGCRCPTCTNIPADHPARLSARRAREPGRGEIARVDFGALVERARSVDILAVLRQLGCEPRRRERAWIGRCPLHDDEHPSLSIDPIKGLAYCFPCGRGGDGIWWTMTVRGLSFAEAVRELAA